MQHVNRLAGGKGPLSSKVQNKILTKSKLLPDTNSPKSWPAWLRWLVRPGRQRVAGSSPSQGTRLGCRLDPQSRGGREATGRCFSLPSVFSSLFLSLKSIFKNFFKGPKLPENRTKGNCHNLLRGTCGTRPADALCRGETGGCAPTLSRGRRRSHRPVHRRPVGSSQCS